ncbi:MAG: helix-hairpin-helix domain-containing protein [Bryobacterales bacterium]|nr:helix-hairpin-helix domain-containing protein [Bryobacterales bacterium]
MGLLDRDYMHKHAPLNFPEQPRSNPVRRWWRLSSLTTILTTGILAFSLASAAVWFVRDLDLFGTREGSLRVNVNTATLDELEAIPGIGPALASTIVADRPCDEVGE